MEMVMTTIQAMMLMTVVVIGYARDDGDDDIGAQLGRCHGKFIYQHCHNCDEQQYHDDIDADYHGGDDGDRDGHDGRDGQGHN